MRRVQGDTSELGEYKRSYLNDEDAIKSEEYEILCEKLIQQFKVLWGSLKSEVPDVEKFMRDFNMQCPMAATRLIHSGLPATIEHKTKQSSSDPEAASVAESVQHFITAMDALKLRMVAVDQLCPILSDLISCMSKVQSLPPDFPPKGKIREAYQRLYQKPANYELPDEDVRQLMYDLESSYNMFLAALKSGRS